MSYKIKISFFNGSNYKFQRTSKKIIKMNNINNLVFNMFKIEDIKQIEVFCWNNNTKKFYKELTYHHLIEKWKKNHNRIECKWNDRFKERFYIGRSTGFIPIYLQISRNDSTGGGALCFNNFNQLKIIY